MKPTDQEPDAGQWLCVRCGVVTIAHPKDGMGECPDCAEKDWPPALAITVTNDFCWRRRGPGLCNHSDADACTNQGGVWIPMFKVKEALWQQN